MAILCAEISSPSGTRYVSLGQYCTRPDDTPSNVLFDPRLVDVIYERALTFPVWTRGGTGSAISSVELVNADGALDSWLGEAWKDRRILFRSVAPRAAYSTATLVGSVIIERIEAAALNRVRFVCRSTLERIAKNITNAYTVGINNIQVRSQSKPMSLGRVRWSDPRPQRVASGFVKGLYDVADDLFEELLEVRQRGALESRNDSPLLTGGGYFEDQFEGRGFLFGTQNYRLAAEVRGTVRREATITTNPTFPTATAGVPDGWTVTVDGDSTVDYLGAGAVQLKGENATCRLEQAHTMVTGARYQIEVGVTETTNSLLDITYGGTALRRVGDIVGRTIICSFTAAAGVTMLGVGIAVGVTATATISAIRVFRIHRIDSLSEMMRFVAIARLGLVEDDIDLTAAAAIEATSAYRLAFASTGDVNGDVLLKRAALSYGAGLFQDRFGKLRPARLKAPATSADFELSEWQVPSILGYTADTADGLSTRLNYGRNYAVHSDEDMTGITDQALRADLGREVRTVTTTVSLHSSYAGDAAKRDPLDSLLSEQSDAQAEIDRICGLYTVPRCFISIRARVDSAETAYTIEPGQTVRLTHRRYGLSAGRNFLVVMARSTFTTGSIDLMLWGAA